MRFVRQYATNKRNSRGESRGERLRPRSPDRNYPRFHVTLRYTVLKYVARETIHVAATLLAGCRAKPPLVADRFSHRRFRSNADEAPVVLPG